MFFVQLLVGYFNRHYLGNSSLLYRSLLDAVAGVIDIAELLVS